MSIQIVVEVQCKPLISSRSFKTYRFRFDYRMAVYYGHSCFNTMKENKMKGFLLLLLFTLGGVSVQAQSNLTTETGQVEIRLFGEAAKEEKAIGTPYISEQFIPAIVDDFKKSYLVRFNASSGLMEFKNENFLTLVMSNEQDHVVVLQDGSRRVYKTVDLNGSRKMMLESWADGEGNAAFVMESIAFLGAETAQSSYGTDKPARYERSKDKVFYQVAGGLLLEMPVKKKKILALFSKTGLKEFYKKEKINVKNVKDLVKVFKFYIVD